MIARSGNEWEDEKGQRADHHVQPGAEEEVHFAHVVGGARHGIAHRLQVVKGHALAQQAGIQLAPHVAFHDLGAEFKAKIARKLQKSAPAEHARMIRECLPSAAGQTRGGDNIEGIADLHLDDCQQTGVTQRADQGNEEIHHWRRACEITQRTGERRSVWYCWGMVNSADSGHSHDR